LRSRGVCSCVARPTASLDVSLAALPFEEEVLARASRWRQVGDVWLVTCSPEDLIVYKLVAARPQDLADIQNVVRSRRASLDVDRVREWGRQFADVKEDPDLLRPFEDALRATR
jgi:predicted nucleotidyltransferase